MHQQFSIKDYFQRKTLMEGCKIKNYVIIKQIGQGQFGQVFKAYDESSSQQKIVAIKILDVKAMLQKTTMKKVKKILQLSLRELQNLKKVNSKYVVKYYDFFELDKGNLKFIVMEYLNGQTLQQHIVNLYQKKRINNEKESLQILYDIAKGIQDLHALKIMHRDLHPCNIMHNGENWVILDLGFSKMVLQNETAQQGTNLGALIIKAPQIIHPSCRYGLKVDIWSLGVILFYCLTGRYLFTEQQSKIPPDKMLQLIKLRLKVQFQNNQQYKQHQILRGMKVNQNMINFVQQILQFDQTKRMNINQLQRHNMFKQNKIKVTQEQSTLPIKYDDFSLRYQQQCDMFLKLDK